MTMREVVIVDGVRSPFVKSGAEFAKVRAHELGRVPMRELIERLEIGDGLGSKARVKVDEVCIGNVGSPEDAANIARVVGMQAGLNKSIPGYTVHRNCASGMEAIMQGWLKIGSGQADVMLVGGVESMSGMPLIYNEEALAFFGRMMRAKTPMQQISTLMKAPVGLLNALMGKPSGFMKPIIAIQEGLTDPFCGMNMGQTADLLAKEFQLSREDQDKYAVESHRKAVQATENGKLAEEMCSIALPMKYNSSVTADIGPRKGQSVEQLAKLKPFFDKVNGTVTVGNACPITDGAAMLALMSADTAKAAGYKVLGRIRSAVFTGHEPERMGLGPAYAIHAALKKAGGLKLSQMDVVEINEAFAAQVMAVLKAMSSKEWCSEKLGASEAVGEVDPARLNPNGGAIALGHPVGSSGARIVLTALKELKRSNKQFGIASLCIGGGQGGAVVVERGA